MKSIWAIPVLASVLILGSLGLSQIVLGQTTINNLADLSVIKSADVPLANAGDTVTWTISVLNLIGPSAAQTIVVFDLLPPEVSYVSDDSAGTYSSVTGIWNVPGPLAVGTNTSLKITTTVNAGFGGLVFNTATITISSVQDGTSINDSSTGSFEIPELDLSLSKSADPFRVNAGETVKYIFTVRNLSDKFDATNIVVEDVMPDGVLLSGFFAIEDQSAGAGTVTVAAVITQTTAIFTIDRLNSDPLTGVNDNFFVAIAYTGTVVPGKEGK